MTENPFAGLPSMTYDELLSMTYDEQLHNFVWFDELTKKEERNMLEIGDRVCTFTGRQGKVIQREQHNDVYLKFDDCDECVWMHDSALEKIPDILKRGDLVRIIKKAPREGKPTEYKYGTIKHDGPYVGYWVLVDVDGHTERWHLSYVEKVPSSKGCPDSSNFVHSKSQQAEVEFEHVVHDGKCKLKIVAFRGIIGEGLPFAYTMGPHMTLRGPKILYINGHAYRVNQVLTELQASKLVKQMKAYGKRLHEINANIRASNDHERREKWIAKGNKVVKI